MTEAKAFKEKSGDPAETEYGTEYLTWKKWGEDQFGVLSKAEWRYFLAETRRAHRTFPPGSRVLEVGFGNGNFLQFGREQQWQISGTEANQRLVETARNHGFDVYHVESLQEFPSDHFDLVVAFDVLEHIPQEMLIGFLLEVTRVLKDKGCFLARFPNGDSPLGLVNQNGDLTHITVIGSGKVRFLAGKTGLHILSLQGEAQPLWGGSVLHVLHRLIVLPLKKLINLFVRMVFFPHGKISFCALNLTFIGQVVKPGKPNA